MMQRYAVLYYRDTIIIIIIIGIVIIIIILIIASLIGSVPACITILIFLASVARNL